MSKFTTFILAALLGAVLGGVLVFYFFVGAPRAGQVPGAPIKPPDAGGQPPGTAVVVLDQQFFNTVLQTIFRDMDAPAFPLGLGNSPQCESKISLKPEGSGVTTGLRLENGQINAPLAFAGSANAYGLSCLPFTGWAQANLQLRFDESQQTVFGQINVQTVNLDGVSPVASGLITPLVQSSLNSRVNPIQILRGEQIALSLPIQSANGRLNAKVKDVRAETKDNAVYLHVTYDFAGVRGQ